ncbi:MAG: hypothetical protein IPP96_15290 [Chitinophagaceae bacterium]|nr:hypothetical protein [Chitinophagaceae bacterium]
MKKVYTGILAILYLAVSSGVAMEIHYCMGKKAGMEFYGSSSDKCGKCGMTDKETGCCHDEFKFCKISDSHYSASNDIQLTPGDFIIANAYSRFQWQVPVGDELASVNDHSPPDHAGPSALLLNCVFRL